jgi:hypothetical protein
MQVDPTAIRELGVKTAHDNIAEGIDIRPFDGHDDWTLVGEVEAFVKLLGGRQPTHAEAMLFYEGYDTVAGPHVAAQDAAIDRVAIRALGAKLARDAIAEGIDIIPFDGFDWSVAEDEPEFIKLLGRKPTRVECLVLFEGYDTVAEPHEAAQEAE